MPEDRVEIIQVRVTERTKRVVRAAAGAEDMTISEWVRESLTSAAQATLDREIRSEDSEEPDAEPALPDGGTE